MGTLCRAAVFGSFARAAFACSTPEPLDDGTRERIERQLPCGLGPVPAEKATVRRIMAEYGRLQRQLESAPGEAKREEIRDQLACLDRWQAEMAEAQRKNQRAIEARTP